MPVIFYVVNKCKYKVYLRSKKVSDIPSEFTLGDEDEWFLLKNVFVEENRIGIFAFVMLFGFIGIVISKYHSGLIGITIGLAVGMYEYIKTQKDIRMAKQELENRIKERK